MEHSISKLQITSSNNSNYESSELLMREKCEMREKINELESKLKDSRMVASLKKMNRKYEKKRLDEDNNDLKLRILQLEKEANMFDCEKVNLRDRCVELCSKTYRLSEQVRELEEQKIKLLSIIDQENEKFERMISMGKEYGDMSGLGYNSNESTTYSTKNTFFKAKEKAYVLPQVTQQQSNTYVGKAFSSSKEKGLKNSLRQIPFQRQRNFEKRESSFSKGNTKDTHYSSSLKSKMFHGNQSTSTKRNFNNYGRRHDWKNQNTSHNNKNSIYRKKKRENRSYTANASISRRPSPTCYYCGPRGHMKVDSRKRLNDLKSSRF